jgi:acetylornithine deacetylase/succinyl-diaminopimelate desuccinylase family protein
MNAVLRPQELEQIVGCVDELRSDLVAAVTEAVRIPSITPNYPGESYGDLLGGEAAVAQLVGARYKQAGCDIDIFAVEPGRENCVGLLRGEGRGRSLIFNGHIDVVPPGPSEDWTDGDPWSGRVAEGRIWGRGSCDMKGGVLAQAYAAIALREAGIRLQGDLILEAVVGEEMMEHHLGTTACVQRGYSADAAVVSEPSAPPAPLTVAPVTAGVLWFEVSLQGRPSHTSMRGETIRAGGYGTDVGVNAIDKAMLIHRALRDLEEEWGLTKQHPLFRPGHFAINPGVFIGGPRNGLVPFSIPDRATIDYIVWYSPSEDCGEVRAEIEHQIAMAAQLDKWLRRHPPVVEWKHHWPATATDVADPIVLAACAAHEAITTQPAVVAGFVAVNDATFLNQAGIPTVTYGPGDLRVAHAVDENLPIADLVTAAKTYAVLAAEWCGVSRKRQRLSPPAEPITRPSTTASQE